MSLSSAGWSRSALWPSVASSGSNALLGSHSSSGFILHKLSRSSTCTRRRALTLSASYAGALHKQRPMGNLSPSFSASKAKEFGFGFTLPEREKEELIWSLPPTKTNSLRPFACSPLHTAHSPKGIKKRAMAIAIALGQQLRNSPQEHRAAWMG